MQVGGRQVRQPKLRARAVLSRVGTGICTGTAVISINDRVFDVGVGDLGALLSRRVDALRDPVAWATQEQDRQARTDRRRHHCGDQRKVGKQQPQDTQRHKKCQQAQHGIDENGPRSHRTSLRWAIRRVWTAPDSWGALGRGIRLKPKIEVWFVS